MKPFAKLQQLAQQRGAKLTLELHPYTSYWTVTWEFEVTVDVEQIVELDEERIVRGDKDFGCACARVLDDLPYAWSWDD